jgi:hypothetical protein
MIDNTPNTKLDEAVKNALKEFDASADSNDWSRMENMLNAAPKQTQFNWKYSLTIIIGITILGGGYMIYKQLSNSSKNEMEVDKPLLVKPSTPTPAVQTKVTPTKEPESTTPEITESQVEMIKAEETKIISKEIKAPITTTSTKEKNKNKDTKATLKTDSEKNNTKVHPIIRMGNEPIFGDMLDSSRGVIGTTQEKDETKKAAKTQSNKNIGWDNIMFSNVNPDSIRKHRESMKKDTLKN